MNHELEKIARRIRPSLPEGERARMAGEFAAFMDAHPAAEAKHSVPSPFFRHGFAVAFSILFIVGGPALYAAERSLPNDPFYPLKVDVLEPLVLATASVSRDAEVGIEGVLVERRLREAKRLVTEDRFGAEESAHVLRRVSAHIESVQEYVEDAETGGNLSDALEAGSELEAVLAAYGKALTALSDSDGEDVNDSYVDLLVSDIEKERSDTEDTSENIEETLAENPSAESEKYLMEVSDEAEDVLGRARKDAMVVDADPALVDEALAALSVAEDAYNAAVSSEASGVPGSALTEFRDALRGAKEALILLEEEE